MRRVVTLLAALLLAVAGLGVATPPAVGASSTEPPSVAGQLLVGYERGTSAQQRADAREHGGTRLVDRVVTEDGDRTTVELVEVVNGATRDEAMRRFTSNPTVRFAEPNWIYEHEVSAPDDPYMTDGSLWGMAGDATSPANQYGSQAGEAWAAATGAASVGSSTVYVGVIDEGIQFDHPDLAGQVWSNPFDAVDGVDNDGNGYTDDAHGWDFAGGNNTIYDGGTSGGSDDHGTHVSGTIGAKANNGQGVAGMNWNVTLISAKFLGRNGGTTANAVKAVDYLTDLKTRHGLNLVATNNSWGGGGFSQALLDAINRGGDANILFVAAAGNGGSDGVGDNNDSTANYPSNYQCTRTAAGAARGFDCLIAVASITSSGGRSSFSNYGAATVDLGAPGSGIWSTTAYNTYSSYSGTSMATPHVTGAAALYVSAHVGATASQIKSAILGSAVPTSSLAGTTVSGGRLNVSAFLGTPAPSAPSAPQNLVATPGESLITLTWDAPVTDGGSQLTGYNIYRDDTTPAFASTNAATRTFPDNVSNGTSHSYVVRAVNGVNEGPASSPATATAAAPAPVERTLTVTGGQKKKNGQTPVIVTWGGFAGTNVDVTRSGSTISTANDGSLTEMWRGSGTVTYTVCETGSPTACASASTTI